MSTMSRVKLASKQKRTTKAAVLGAAGLSFSVVNSASASTIPTFGIPPSDNTSPGQRVVLSDEEMVDVSLATFYLFDKEHIGSGVQLARGCNGCRCGGGCNGLRGCGVGGCAGCRGCGCGGCGGCCGCGFFGGFWEGCAIGGGCCGSWGSCRLS